MSFSPIQTAILPFLLAFNASATVVHYVDLKSANPTPPYTDWSTAATNIQDAVDAAETGDQILVTNGIYRFGGRPINGVLTNRVALGKAVTVQSVNGPVVTTVQGSPGIFPDTNYARCAYLASGAILSGFTLTNGATLNQRTQPDGMGGGVWCESDTAVVSNCIVTANFASDSGGGVYQGAVFFCLITNNAAVLGGGACKASLSDCVLTNNSASGQGGGVYQCVLNNCVLVGNTVPGTHSASGGGAASSTLTNCTIVGNGQAGFSTGGGTYNCSLMNCIIYYNLAGTGANDSGSTLSYCCIPAIALAGAGNFTAPPRFVDQAHLNLRLQADSPCINAGNNTYASGATDLDGNPRIVGGTVDVGAYEFQTPASLISYAWLQQYKLPTDGSADFADTDGDGMNNWQEWRCGTVPTNALSVLRMLSPSNGVSSVKVPWASVSGVSYYIQRSTNLFAQPAFTTLQSNITGQASTTTYTDANASGEGAFFYRVGVQ